VLVCFSPFLIIPQVVTARKEEVEVAETHEMDILGPHTSRIASSLRLLSTGQDISDEAQSVISQPEVEGVTSICPCCLIPRRSLCSVTGSGGSDAPEMNIDQPRSRDEVSGTTSDSPTQAEARTPSRASFLMIVEISMT
jgi:hypothetical protein